MSSKVDPIRPQRPIVSVVIPTYNRADTLPGAVASVLGQDYPDFEVLIVDDGSTDATRQVVKGIADPRVHYIHQANAGLSAARNTGILRARGEYLAFLDSDDLFLPNKLSVQVRQLDENPDLGMVTGGFRYITWQGEALAERRPWEFFPELNISRLFLGCPIIVNAVLVRKDWVDREKGFNPDLRRVEDLDLWLRLAVAGCNMAWTPQVVCAYRMHPQQMVRDAARQSQITVQVYEQIYRRDNLPAVVEQIRPRAIAGAYLSGACRELGAGLYAEAQEPLAKAVELDPALLDGERPAILSILAAWAAEPITPNPAQFVQGLFAQLGPALEKIRPARLRLLFEACFSAVLDGLWVGSRGVAKQAISYLLAVEPDAFQRVADWMDVIIERVDTYPQDRREELLESFFRVIPPAFAGYRKKAVGRLWMARGFKALEQGRQTEAGSAFRQGVRRDPAWLLNRGVLSVIIRDLLGAQRDSI